MYAKSVEPLISAFVLNTKINDQLFEKLLVYVFIVFDFDKTLF